MFTTFSAERLFAYTDADSTVFDVIFFVPGTTDVPAAVPGFGAVFTDVDEARGTSIEYFDTNGTSLGVFNVPISVGGDEGLSFLGVNSFPGGSQVARVRITTGSQPVVLGEPDGFLGDVVVMDDFLYGEPQPF